MLQLIIEFLCVKRNVYVIDFYNFSFFLPKQSQPVTQDAQSRQESRPALIQNESSG